MVTTFDEALKIASSYFMQKIISFFFITTGTLKVIYYSELPANFY